MAPARASEAGFVVDREGRSRRAEPWPAGDVDRIAGASGESSGAPAHPAGVRPISESEGARADAAPPAFARGDDNGGGNRSVPFERHAAWDGPSAAKVEGTEPSARQQPPGEIQLGRLPQLLHLQGNAAPGVGPSVGMHEEIGPASARTVGGAASVGPERLALGEQVALQITRAIAADRTEIRIRLDPPELGEVDIQLEFRDLRLIASVGAERPDTLELLQRDARSLARALREAGLELADSDLSFAHNGRNDRPDPGLPGHRTMDLPQLPTDAAPLTDLALGLAGHDGFVSLSDGRMDLRV